MRAVRTVVATAQAKVLEAESLAQAAPAEVNLASVAPNRAE